MKVASFLGITGHGVLALVAFWVPSIAISGPIQTRADTLTIIPGGTDTDTSPGGASESYVEGSVGGGLWTSSALAESGGNLEVGVTAGRSFVDASASAFSDLSLTQHYQSGDSRIGAVRFTVQPGEILFRSDLVHHFQGEFDGSLIIGLSASLNNVVVDVYTFRLEVKSTNDGIDINSGSTGTALVHVSEVLSGDTWGVRTAGFTDVLVLTPAIFPGDVVSVGYSMHAEAHMAPLDAFFTYSVKIGDPLDTLGGGTLAFTDAVPEPSSACLTIAGLFALTALLSSRRKRHLLVLS